MLGAPALIHHARQVLDRLPGHEQPSSQPKSRDVAAVNGGIGLVSSDAENEGHLLDGENQPIRR
jgi:hypothetical protein